MRGRVTFRIVRRHAAAVVLVVATVLALIATTDPAGLHILHWIRAHVLTDLGVTAAATAAVPILTIVTRRLDRRREEPAAIAATHDRAFMLRRVRRKWISEPPGGSPVGAVHLILGLKRRAEMLPAAFQTADRDHQATPIPLGTRPLRFSTRQQEGC